MEQVRGIIPSWRWVVVVLVVAALMGCSSGGGGGGGGSEDGGNSGSCGDAATCLNTFNDVFAGASTALETVAGLSSNGTIDCIQYTYNGIAGDAVTFTLVFNNCLYQNGDDSLAVNGNLTFTSSGTGFSFSSTGLSIVGTTQGQAVDFSCSMNVTYVLTPTPSISGSMCGIALAAPAVPTNLVADVNGLSCDVHLVWDPSDGATDYEVFWGMSSPVGETDTQVIGSFPGAEATWFALPASATIYAAVRSVNLVGDSAFSDSKQITITGCGG